jgi:hypothetical protein
MSVSTGGKPVFLYMPAARGDTLATSRIEAGSARGTFPAGSTTHDDDESSGRTKEGLGRSVLPSNASMETEQVRRRSRRLVRCKVWAPGLSPRRA